MVDLPPLPAIFGNYTIKGISEVLAPEAVGWLPVAPGWRYVALALLLLLGWRCWLYWKKWRRNRYRRAALQQLDRIIRLHRADPGVLPALSALLKATALQAYPRAEVARLSGATWLGWLNARGNNSPFSATSGTLLTETVYRTDKPVEPADLQQLQRELANWISTHREADRA